MQARGPGQKLFFDSEVLDVKYAMDIRHQYDGNEKAGEQWKTGTKIFLIGRIMILKEMLKWAEDHDNTMVTAEATQSLQVHMAEDPTVVSHLLWAYLGVNLTGAAREIYGNVEQGNGLEVWRRINKHIFSKNEQRRAELYQHVHNPRAAAKPSDVASALEEWDTSQRLYREVGGKDLNGDDLKEIVMRLLPWSVKKDLISKLNDFATWDGLKNHIKEHARVLMIHFPKAGVGLNNVDDDVVEPLSEAFWASTDELEFEAAVEAMGSSRSADAIMALVERRRKPGWKPRPAKKGGGKGEGKGDGGKSSSNGKKMLCANCLKPGAQGRGMQG